MPAEKTEIVGSQKMAPDAPFKLEMKVMLVGQSGQYEGYTAWASLDLPPGKLMTEKDVKARLASTLAEAGEGFRLATRHEFVNEVLVERAGVDMNFAVPGPNKFRLVEEQSS